METCRHWAKGWCIRADACRFAHPAPGAAGTTPGSAPDPPANARVGALSLSRSDHHEKLLRDVVEAAQGGGLPAVGYAVARGGTTVWAVALPCGRVALLTPFPVVPWSDMAILQEASLVWVCTWHTHPAGMDPQRWQARAVVT